MTPARFIIVRARIQTAEHTCHVIIMHQLIHRCRRFSFFPEGNSALQKRVTTRVVDRKMFATHLLQLVTHTFFLESSSTQTASHQ